MLDVPGRTSSGGFTLWRNRVNSCDRAYVSTAGVDIAAQKRAFLDAYRRAGTVMGSRRSWRQRLGPLDPRRHYDWLNEHPDYVRDFADAVEASILIEVTGGAPRLLDPSEFADYDGAPGLYAPGNGGGPG